MFKSPISIVKKFVQTEEDKKTDFLKRENSNFIYGLPLLRKNVSNYVEQEYLFKEIFPEKLVKKYTEGEIYIHDKSLAPYCNSTSCRDIAMRGLPTTAKNMIQSKATDNFFYFTRHLSNAVTLISQQVSGAVMLAGATTVLASYLYFEETYKSVVRSDKEIYKYIRSLIWELNMPLRAGSESPFSNITLEFGKPSSELKDENIVIDGHVLNQTYNDIPDTYFDRINKTILDVMSKGAGNGVAFTFPLLTVPIDDNFDWDNKIFTYSLEKLYDWGGMYFENFQTKPFQNTYYQDLNPKIKPRNPEISRSLCPLDGSQKVLYYCNDKKQLVELPIRLLYQKSLDKNWKTVKTIQNGSLIDVKVNKFTGNKKRLKITLTNNHQIITTHDHLNKVLDNKHPKLSFDLTTDDYLPFSRKPITGKGLDYDDGYIIGAFLGDGSYSGKNDVIFTVNKKSKVYTKLKELTINNYGGYCTEYDYNAEISNKLNSVNLKCTSPILYSLIKMCTSGDYVLDKALSSYCFSKSKKFREGIIDGLYGVGDCETISTSSVNLVESLTTLFMSLGIPSSIDREELKESVGSNPLYSIKSYRIDDLKTYKDIYKVDDDYVWFRIKSIEEYSSLSDSSFCFEVVDNIEPIYSLPNGIVTHNCRLQIDLSLLSQSGGGVFGSSTSNVGAVQVLNLNLNRIALKYRKNPRKFKEAIKEDLELMQEGHQAKRQWLENHKDLYPTFFALNDSLKNYFNVFAVTGMHEAMMTLGFKKGMKDLPAKIEAHRIMQYISEIVESFIVRDNVACGIEYAPAENAAIKMARDDIRFSQAMLTRTHYQGTKANPYLTAGCMLPFSEENLIEVIENHAEFQAYATSGSIFHNFLETELSPEDLKKYIKRIFSKPINYMTITPTRTVCNSCGHAVIGDIPGDDCPNCGSDDLSVWSRVIGYYKPVARKKLHIEKGSYEGVYNFWSAAKRIDWASRAKITIDKLKDFFAA